MACLPSLLIDSLNSNKDSMATKKQQTAKVGKVMGEYKAGTLHSGKGGPVVKDATVVASTVSVTELV